MNSPKKTTTRKTPTKRKLPQLNYPICRLADYKNITNSKKIRAFLFMNLIGAVKEGIDRGVNEVGLVKLQGSNVSVLLKKEDWKISLNRAMDFFASVENFETCQKCKELIEGL